MSSSKKGENTHDTISSVGIVAALVISLVSLYFVFNPLPNKPVLNVFSGDESREGITIYVHNGGTAPCVDFRMSYQNVFPQVYQILDYKNSDIRSSNITNESIILSPQHWIPIRGLSKCENNFCSYRLGYLDINEIIPFRFNFGEQEIAHSVTMSCSGQSREIKF